MRLHIDRSGLLTSLSHALSVVEKRNTVPILSHVQLTASEQTLSIVATDIDITLLENIPAQIIESGGVAVPAQHFHDIIKKVSDKVPLQLFVEEGHLHIHAGRSQFKLPYLPAEEFPQLNHSSVNQTWSLPVGICCTLLDSTRFAMSLEEKRYHLNGICFNMASTPLFSNIQGRFLRAIATDLHRLACVEESFEPSFDSMPEFIISRKTVQELRRVLDDASGEVEIGLADARIEFAYKRQNSQGVLSARLVEGSFPDYEEAFAVHSQKVIVVPTRDFVQSIDRVGVLIDEKVRAIHLTAQNNTLTLSSGTSQMGQAVEDIDVDYPSEEPLKLCFNARYLMEMAQQIDTDTMELCIDNPDAPVLVRPRSELLRKSFIVMPMHV